MRRSPILATFLLLCAPVLVAQGRFHGIPSSVTSFRGGSFHGISPSVTSFGPRHFGPGRSFGGGVFVHGGFGFGHRGNFSVFFGGGFPHRRVFFRHRRFFPVITAFPVYGGPIYPYDPYYSYAPPAYPMAYQSAPDYDRGDDQLAREVDRLRQEVDRLRDERYDRDRAPQPPRAEAKPPADQPATVLVFRDGKRMETSNYAVAGQTLWIFSEQRARKVPLSDLDLAATRAINEERGIEFNAGRR